MDDVADADLVKHFGQRRARGKVVLPRLELAGPAAEFRGGDEQLGRADRAGAGQA